MGRPRAMECRSLAVLVRGPGRMLGVVRICVDFERFDVDGKGRGACTSYLL